MVVISPPGGNRRGKTFEHAYKSILTARRRSPSTSAASVILLVAPEVDALCAARIFSVLFKQDDVTYRIIPVSGYPGLEQIRDELITYLELHTLILLNIGSVLDLPSSDWFGGFNPQVTIHVIDSARPQNLSSLFGVSPEAQRIVVWDDGNSENLQEERKALEALMYESDSDSESNSDESERSDSDEEEEEQDDLQSPRPRKRPKKDPADSDATDEEEEEEEGQPPRRRRKLNNQNSKPGLSRDEKDTYRGRIERHYTSGTWHGQSTAGIVYVLATTLERADNDMLWLSILGLTQQYITSRIPRDRYDGYHLIYKDEVARLNPVGETSTTASTTLHPDDYHIRASEELRFTLFRHWNLYDAMYHSSYVANKLGIWKEKGRKKLQGLLAKMGFSLQQCQQSYAHMDMDLKRHLVHRMDAIAPEYGLVELSYPSFVRAFGFRSQPLCAADVVESVSALLEAAGGVRLEVEIDGGKGGGEWFGGGRIWDLGRKSDAEKNGAATEQWRKRNEEGGDDAPNGDEDDVSGADGLGATMEKWWVKNFWVAFDALGKDVTLVREALPLSMALQRAIIRQGSSLIDKQVIRTFRTFKLAIVKEGPDVPLFCHPGTLSRLGLWLADAMRDRQGTTRVNSRGKKRALPFVVACLDEKASSYLVVGVNAASEFGDVRKNQFGLAFIDAKSQSNARTRHGTFDTSVVEVSKDDLTSFLEALQLKA